MSCAARHIHTMAQKKMTVNMRVLVVRLECASCHWYVSVRSTTKLTQNNAESAVNDASATTYYWLLTRGEEHVGFVLGPGRVGGF
jgi:hypothetical protein